ncbi:MAG: hypothetical protein WBC04_17565 [Candidatus Acidiferrales bacterium]
MRVKPQGGSDSLGERSLQGFLRRAAVLLLLVAVVGLSTLAKHSQYLPNTNPARYVSISSKMNVAYSPAVLEPKPLRAVARIVPPQPSIGTSRREEPEPPPIERMGLTVSLQRRSPPSSFA